MLRLFNDIFANNSLTEHTDVASDVRKENFPAHSNVYEVRVRTFIWSTDKTRILYKDFLN